MQKYRQNIVIASAKKTVTFPVYPRVLFDDYSKCTVKLNKKSSFRLRYDTVCNYSMQLVCLLILTKNEIIKF